MHVYCSVEDKGLHWNHSGRENSIKNFYTNFVYKYMIPDVVSISKYAAIYIWASLNWKHRHIHTSKWEHKFPARYLDNLSKNENLMFLDFSQKLLTGVLHVNYGLYELYNVVGDEACTMDYKDVLDSYLEKAIDSTVEMFWDKPDKELLHFYLRDVPYCIVQSGFNLYGGTKSDSIDAMITVLEKQPNLCVTVNPVVKDKLPKYIAGHGNIPNIMTYVCQVCGLNPEDLTDKDFHVLFVFCALWYKRSGNISNWLY